MSEMRAHLSAEQEAAIRARGPVVAVSAGAGSGKTTVLVERFIDLVQRDRVSPLEILAITFTEKAAAEMKERIVRRFEECEDAPHRREAEAAYISTIHGFCARILREHPLAARLDPTFRVMDELTRNVFLDEQLERLYTDDWYVEHEPLFPKRYESERPLLFELIEEAAFLPAEFGTSGDTEQGLSVEEHVARAMRRVREHRTAKWVDARGGLPALEGLLARCVVTGPTRSAQHGAVLGAVRQLLGVDEPDRRLAQQVLDNTGFTGGIRDRRLAEQIKAALQPIKDALEVFADLDLADVEQAEREVFAPMRVEIYSRAAALRRSYEEFKWQHGFLDFDDMQRRALELLEDGDVRESFASRFTHILLDEAQDTNDVQMRIIDRLREGRQSLFAVGDVKQAIYGFRGANVEIFASLSSGAHATSLSLVDNYRSRAGVIDVVNEVGTRLWSDGSITFEPLQPRAAYEPNGASTDVDLWLVEQQRVEGEDGRSRIEPADDVREREGIALAAWIRDAVDGKEPLTVYDRHTRSYRPVRYGDIAILSGTRTPFPAYERALATVGIPFVKDGGREFFQAREVQDVLAAVRIVGNPLDEMSLLAALRSPLFGWGDRDLARLRVAAGKHSLWGGMRNFHPEEGTASPAAYETIRDLRRHAAFVPPAGLIEMICDVTAYRAALLSLPRGRAQIANIDQLIEFARATATLDGPTLDRFIHRATLAERYLGMHREAPLSAPDEDAVVVSTIHGAKGLEWPIVLLAGLDGDLVRANASARYSAPDGALILAFRGEDGDMVRSVANAPLVERAREREEAEARRLMYVAMTRARERLILSGRHNYRESKRQGLTVPIRWFATALGIEQPEVTPRPVRLGASDVLVDFLSPERIAPRRRALTAVHDEKLAAARRAVRAGEPVVWDGEAGTMPAAVDRVLSGDSPVGKNGRALAMTTVTQLVYFFRCPMVYYFDLVLQIDEHPRRRGKGGMVAERKLSALERGTQVHELLERADLTAEPTSEAARLTAQLADVSVSERATIEAMLVKVLADPLLERARNATRLEREYPFYLNVGGTTVQGVIDLVFRDREGRGVVVDYKSNDLAAPGRLETLTDLYRPQIELYALAARQAGLVEPGEATLYFLNRAQAVTTQVDARRLEVVEASARDALDQIARSAWDTEPGEKCRACGYRKRGFCEVGRKFSD